MNSRDEGTCTPTKWTSPLIYGWEFHGPTPDLSIFIDHKLSAGPCPRPLPTMCNNNFTTQPTISASFIQDRIYRVNWVFRFYDTKRNKFWLVKITRSCHSWGRRSFRGMRELPVQIQTLGVTESTLSPNISIFVREPKLSVIIQLTLL